MIRNRVLFCMILLSFGSKTTECTALAGEPEFASELVFPLNSKHNHAPGIVECPNGDLFVTWYRGAGERQADDVAVYAAWKPQGAKAWMEPFVLADTPRFPDCNTALFVDRDQQLWLFYPTILANSWESCLTNFKIAKQYVVREKVRVAESIDEGESWGPVGVCDLANPGAGVDGIRLANGKWLLVYNDTTKGRNRLAVSLSNDEGRTWPVTRHLEDQPTGSFHYPAVTQGSDGTIHAIYSYFVEGGKSMKHAAFLEEWLTSDAGAR